jgi:hypothetical protein
VLAHQEGWDVVARFEDNGKSGGYERANARAALDMIKDGRADVLAVYAYDRWSRQGIEKAGELIAAINSRRNTRSPALFYAQRESIRSDQEDWELRVASASDLAKRERDRMVSRTTASLKRLRGAGRFAGGVVGFGYRPVDNPDGPGRTLVPSTSPRPPAGCTRSAGRAGCTGWVEGIVVSAEELGQEVRDDRTGKRSHDGTEPLALEPARRLACPQVERLVCLFASMMGQRSPNSCAELQDRRLVAAFVLDVEVVALEAVPLRME